MLLQKISKYIYVFGLCLLAAALPLSKAFITIAQMVLGLSWLLNLHYSEKIQQLKKNKILLLFPVLLALHFLFLLNTSDFSYAKKDILIKLPLFVIPFIISSSAPLTQKEIKSVLVVFCSAVFVGACIVIGKYILIKTQYLTPVNVRDLLHFTSHIRFGLMVCLSIALLTHATKNKRVKPLLLLLYSIVVVLSLVFMQALTGLAILCIITIPLLSYLYSWNGKTTTFTVVLLMSLLGAYLFYEAQDILFVKKETTALYKKTLKGNEYFHDTLNLAKENGHYIWRNVCEKELRESWNKRSAIKYDSANANTVVREVLIRYLSSLGEKKDAQAIEKLNANDIKNIENGKANAYNSSLNPVRQRIRESFWEIDAYLTSNYTNESSITKRFVYWNMSFDILKENWLTGVGTGDVQLTFDAQYKKQNSNFNQDSRRHSHNQYLTFFVSFGILGFSFFLFMLYQLLRYTTTLHYRFIAQIFIVITTVSMLTEDTLETQAGVTFVVFFFSLFWVYTKPT